MGLDAYAIGPRGSCRPQRKAFRDVAKLVQAEAGSADCFLGVAGLDCSACLRALEEMTGKNCYDWSAEDVQEAYAAAATYPYKQTVNKDDLWAYSSAYHFLWVCAKYNLSIRFG